MVCSLTVSENRSLSTALRCSETHRRTSTMSMLPDNNTSTTTTTTTTTMTAMTTMNTPFQLSVIYSKCFDDDYYDDYDYPFPVISMHKFPLGNSAVGGAPGIPTAGLRV